jgi:hypothetical protein
MKKLLSVAASLLLAAQPLSAARQTPPAPQPTQASAATPASPAARQKAEAQAQFVPVEELLPADTLLFAATTNLAGLRDNFRRLDAVKVLEARLPKEMREGAESPLAEMLSYLSFGIEDASALEGTRTGLALLKPETQAAADGAPGFAPEKESSVRAQVGVPEGANLEVAQAVKRPAPGVIAFIESSDLKTAEKARKQFIKFFSDNFEDLGKLSEVKQAARQEVTVDRFKNGYLGTMVGTTYLLGEPFAVDAVLALRSSRDAARLSDNADFARARSQGAVSSGFFAYLNSKPLVQMMNREIAQITHHTGPLNLLFNGVFALESVAFSSTFDRDGVVDRLALNFDQARLSLFKAVFSGPQTEMRATGMIPAGTPVVVSHSVDWPTVYDRLIVPMVFTSMAQTELMREVYAALEKEREAWEKEAEEAAANNRQPPPAPESMARRYGEGVDPQKLKEATEAVVARYERDLGYKMRDELAKDFGHEIAVAYGVPKLKANAETGKPEEGFAVMLAVRDREAARSALLRLLAYTVMGNMQAMMGGQAAPPANAAGQDEGEEKTKKEQKPFDAATAVNLALTLVPRETYKKAEIISLMSFAAVAFTDEYVIFADRADTVKQLLDTPEAGASMLADANYRRATGGSSSSAASRLYVAPRYFDEMLNGFVRTWAGEQALAASGGAAFPLSVPATVAATVESTDRGLSIEAFSPLGGAGMIALDEFASSVRSRAQVNEYDARYALRQIARAEKAYAKTHAGRFAALDALAKEKLKGVNYDFAKLKGKDQIYAYELKLKAGGKGFEATATPVKYGRRSRRSFFVDETGKIRHADKEGLPATAADEADESPLKHPDREGDDEEDEDDQESDKGGAGGRKKN